MTGARGEADKLELSDYPALVRRRWPIIGASILLCAGLAAGYTATREPTFCASAQVLIADTDAQVAVQGDSNVQEASRDLINEISIANSDSVTGEVESRLGYRPNVSVTGGDSSDVLQFSNCASTAQRAADAANVWAEIYVENKQQQAAEEFGLALGSFEERLAELGEQRRALRAPLDEIEIQIARSANETTRAGLQAEAQRVQAGLAVQLQLIDTQLQTLAATITRLELSSNLARAGTARLLQTASAPAQADSSPMTRNVVLGSIAGLLVGFGLALLAENLDRSIKTADDIRGVAVLGSIPRASRPQVAPPLATIAASRSPIAEGYQKLRTAVDFALIGRQIESLLITSTDHEEGRTTTACNLAFAMSAVDHRVVLADLDFRKPEIHRLFGRNVEPGLSDHLLHGTPLVKLAHRVDVGHQNMVVIPVGMQPPSPADFVASPPFARLVGALEREADLVIFDSSPTAPYSDTLSIARHVDAVVVVARAGVTTRRRLAETVSGLEAVGADVLGVCLVGVQAENRRYGSYGDSSRMGRLKSRSAGETAQQVRTSTEPQILGQAGRAANPAGDLQQPGSPIETLRSS